MFPKLEADKERIWLRDYIYLEGYRKDLVNYEKQIRSKVEKLIETPVDTVPRLRKSCLAIQPSVWGKCEMIFRINLIKTPKLTKAEFEKILEDQRFLPRPAEMEVGKLEVGQENDGDENGGDDGENDDDDDSKEDEYDYLDDFIDDSEINEDKVIFLSLPSFFISF